MKSLFTLNNSFVVLVQFGEGKNSATKRKRCCPFHLEASSLIVYLRKYQFFRGKIRSQWETSNHLTIENLLLWFRWHTLIKMCLLHQVKRIVNKKIAKNVQNVNFKSALCNSNICEINHEKCSIKLTWKQIQDRHVWSMKNKTHLNRRESSSMHEWTVHCACFSLILNNYAPWNVKMFSHVMW